MCSAFKILVTMLLSLGSGLSGVPGLPNTASGKAGHWAFQRLDPPNPPPPRGAGRGRTPVDRFVLNKLDPHGLSLNPQADRSTLIRRVSYDLTGLPPAPEEIFRFLSDRADGAYQSMVDRYLSSSRYGERWGNHWLDVAGYADSNGYFSAPTPTVPWRTATAIT